jgi:hypothetical protein
MILILFFTLFLSIGVFAQEDSSVVLFDDTKVHEYTLTFYDSDYATKLEANYVNDDGYVLARFSDGTISLDSVGVRYKGNSSYIASGSSPKKPLKIKFNEFVSGQKYYGIKVLNFSNGYGDPSFLREKIAYDISQKYMPSPRSAFAAITIGSEFIGLYTQVEQVNEQFLERVYQDKTLNLFKASDAGASLKYTGKDATEYYNQLELKTNEDLNDWSGMVSFLNYINNTENELFCNTYTNYMNPDNVAPFLAFKMVMSHFDSYIGSGRNFYLTQMNAAGYMSFVPWDLNLSFGGYPNGWDVYKQSAITTTSIEDRPLFKKLMGCQDFQYKYLAYIKKMINTDASADSIQKAIDKYVPLIQSFVEADPNKFYSISDFTTNLNSKLRTSSGSIPGLTEFSTNRNAFLLSELDGILPEDYELSIDKIKRESSPKISINNKQIVFPSELSNKEKQLEFFSLNGEKLMVINTLAGEVSIPDLSKGIVFVRVKTNHSINIIKYNNK